jgi:hypothetical protein
VPLVEADGSPVAIFSRQYPPHFRTYQGVLSNRYRIGFALDPDVKANIQQAPTPVTLNHDTKPAISPGQNEEVLDSEQEDS